MHLVTLTDDLCVSRDGCGCVHDSDHTQRGTLLPHVGGLQIVLPFVIVDMCLYTCMCRKFEPLCGTTSLLVSQWLKGCWCLFVLGHCG
jgi:hypothetical protein